MSTPPPNRRSRRTRLIDCVILALLIGYVLAGCILVPYHGDESTTLYESRDFTTFFLNGDLAHLIYRVPPPADDPESATRQDLRILNGVFSGDLYGAIDHLAGFTARDLNPQWDWGAGYDYNVARGAYPSPTLLFVARWTSALLTVLSVALVFGTGYRVRGRWTAIAAAAIYTLTPAVLLNGRRAVFEGSLLLTEVLLLYVAVRVIGKRWSWRGVLALGLASGLAILSKHTNALVIMAAYAGIVLYPLICAQARRLAAAPVAVAVAALIAVTLFLAFNPAWWGNPLAMPQIVLDKRQVLIAGQSDPLHSLLSLTSPRQRVATLVRESLVASPQYYENDPIWQTYIGDQIARYTASGLAGLSGSLWAALIGILVVLGILTIAIDWRRAPSFALLIWFGVVAVGLYMLNPVDWQRYYLPLTAPVALLAGQAIGFRPGLLRRGMADRTISPAIPSP